MHSSFGILPEFKWEDWEAPWKQDHALQGMASPQLCEFERLIVVRCLRIELECCHVVYLQGNVDCKHAMFIRWPNASEE